jgi:methenyltetrahydromethanopterin cyclohydrolase
MPQPQPSVNKAAHKLVKKLCNQADKYGIIVKHAKSGATLIDAGIEAKGGFLAGKLITEICLGGHGKAQISHTRFDDLEFPSILIHTDNPTIATLASQFAGWQIKIGDYNAIGSGPARALALKPQEIYDKIGYRDEADVAVVVLETTKEPPETVITYISEQSKITPDNLSIILVPTTSIAGSIQVSGRIVETGVHKLTKLGIDPKVIMYAWGCAPITSLHPKFAQAMGRTNDAILYGGTTYYVIQYDDDEKLKKIVEKAPSLASKSYGRPFYEIFKNASYDFYKIDPNLFAPAVLTVNNAKTGSIFKAGRINIEVFKQSIGLSN